MINPYSQQDLLAFWTTLTQSVCAGNALPAILESIRDQAANPSFAAVVQDMIDGTKQGETLAKCLKKHPEAFHEHVCLLVDGGERIGLLDRVLVLILEAAWRCPNCILG